MKQLECVSTSFELYQVLNKHRLSSGEKPYRNHADLVVKIKKEIGELDAHENVFLGRINNLGKEVQDKGYKLSRKDIYVVSMRESKKVRSSVYDYLEKLEEELVIMKDIVWEVINGQAYIGQEQALKMAGIKHPRLFMRYLKSNEKFYNSVVNDRGLLKNHQCNKHGDRWWKFTKEGFQWLLQGKDKLNDWVGKCKVAEKQSKDLLV